MNNVSNPDTLLKGEDRRYDNNHDAGMRLVGTIVRIDGQPVYVNDVIGEMVLVVNKVGIGAVGKSRDLFGISANDVRLDISSPSIGFMNYQNEAFYVVRRPIRSQRQGLNLNDLHYFGVTRKTWTNFVQEPSVIESVGKTILRDYPSVKSILNDKTIQSAAFSRTWALARLKKGDRFLVFHRFEPVGTFKNGVFQIHPTAIDTIRINSLRNVLSKQAGASYDVRY